MSTMRSHLDRLLDDPEFRRTFVQEAFVVDVMEQLAAWMEAQGVSRAELARRLGTSRANVTRMLQGRNLRLKTLADVVHALGGEPVFTIRSAARGRGLGCGGTVGPVDLRTWRRYHRLRPTGVAGGAPADVREAAA